MHIVRNCKLCAVPPFVAREVRDCSSKATNVIKTLSLHKWIKRWCGDVNKFDTNLLKSCEVWVEHDFRVRGKRNLPGGSGGGEKGACDGALAAANCKVGVAK